MSAQRRRGRPPAGDKPATEVLRFRVTPDELDRFRKAAILNRQSLTEFARLSLNGAVEDVLETEPESARNHRQQPVERQQQHGHP